MAVITTTCQQLINFAEVRYTFGGPMKTIMHYNVKMFVSFDVTGYFDKA